MLSYIALLITAHGAPVLHIEQLGDLPKKDAAALSLDLTEALTNHLGKPPTPSGLPPGSCESEASCVASIRAAQGEVDVLIVRAFDAVTRIRVLTSLLRPGQDAIESTIEVSTDRTHRVVVLTEHFRALFPSDGPATASAAASFPPPPPPPAPKSSGWLPFTLLGVGAAALGAGGVFGIMSASSRDTIEDQALYGTELKDTSADMNRNATIANFCFIAGGVGVVTGAALLLID